MPKRTSGKKKKRRFLSILRKIILIWFGFTISWVLLYRFINPPVTLLMIERGVERMFDGKDWKLEKKWRSFDELSDNLKLAAVAGEDANFLHHWGFDLKAIQKAYRKNKQGANLRGGSTISQQVAKNVFLWPGRSWVRKGFEVYFTGLIELLWGKKRILGVYLNVIEMGDGIYGAEAATQAYFHKPATSLSKARAALLVAIFPNPLHWSPVKPTRFVRYKQQLILKNMRRIKKLDF